jgi:COP9 signalosome complex subunit 1
MDRMSKAFGWEVSELEKHVVALIQKGEIEGRIDKKNMVSTYFLPYASLLR